MSAIRDRGLTWRICLGAYDFQLRLLTWASGVFLLFTGGETLLVSMVYRLVHDIGRDENRFGQSCGLRRG